MPSTPNTSPIPRLDVITAQDLIGMKLPPVRMIVGDLVPAGLFLLAGDPKVGKSLLFQDLAVSVATGQLAWGSCEVDQGDVLYLANEGGRRSFRDRLVKMMELDLEAIEEDDEAVGLVTKRLQITESSEPLGARLEFQIEVWLSEADDPRLVVIDTYSSVAPEAKGANRHQEDYNALAGLSDLATRWPNGSAAVGGDICAGLFRRA